MDPQPDDLPDLSNLDEEQLFVDSVPVKIHFQEVVNHRVPSTPVTHHPTPSATSTSTSTSTPHPSHPSGRQQPPSSPRMDSTGFGMNIDVNVRRPAANVSPDEALVMEFMNQFYRRQSVEEHATTSSSSGSNGGSAPSAQPDAGTVKSLCLDFLNYLNSPSPSPLQAQQPMTPPRQEDLIANLQQHKSQLEQMVTEQRSVGTSTSSTSTSGVQPHNTSVTSTTSTQSISYGGPPSLSHLRQYPHLHESVFHNEHHASTATTGQQLSQQELMKMAQSPPPNLQEPWFQRNFHQNIRVNTEMPFDPEEAPAQEEAPYVRDVNPYGAPRIHPTIREANVENYLDHFVNDVSDPQAVEQMSQQLGHGQHRVPSREPEDFAHEMGRLREMFTSNRLSPQQKDRLVLESYDGFLDELRHREQHLLHMRQEHQYSQLRTPARNWWELKDASFQTELRRYNHQLRTASPSSGGNNTLSPMRPQSATDPRQYYEQIRGGKFRPIR